LNGLLIICEMFRRNIEPIIFGSFSKIIFDKWTGGDISCGSKIPCGAFTRQNWHCVFALRFHNLLACLCPRKRIECKV
jgi:hypothetical protein